MDQQLRVCILLSEESVVVAHTHTKQFITTYDSCSQRFDVFFWAQ